MFFDWVGQMTSFLHTFTVNPTKAFVEAIERIGCQVLHQDIVAFQRRLAGSKNPGKEFSEIAREFYQTLCQRRCALAEQLAKATDAKEKSRLQEQVDSLDRLKLIVERITDHTCSQKRALLGKAQFTPGLPKPPAIHPLYGVLPPSARPPTPPPVPLGNSGIQFNLPPAGTGTPPPMVMRYGMMIPDATLGQPSIVLKYGVLPPGG